MDAEEDDLKEHVVHSNPGSLINTLFDLTSPLERGGGNLLPMLCKGRRKGYLRILKPQRAADHLAEPSVRSLSQSILRPAVEFTQGTSSQKGPFLF